MPAAPPQPTADELKKKTQDAIYAHGYIAICAMLPWFQVHAIDRELYMSVLDSVYREIPVPPLD